VFLVCLQFTPSFPCFILWILDQKNSLSIQLSGPLPYRKHIVGHDDAEHSWLHQSPQQTYLL
jgi:hypothetical protein